MSWPLDRTDIWAMVGGASFGFFFLDWSPAGVVVFAVVFIGIGRVIELTRQYIRERKDGE